MSSSIRKKIARSLSEISRPDDWKWNRWLKPPSSSEEENLNFPMVRVTGRDADQIFLLSPALESYIFSLQNSKVILPEQFNKWLTKKSTKEKTSLILQKKTFRIFISKIKTDVSINLVPQNYTAPLLYSYEPVSSKTLTIEFFNWNETAATEVFQHEFITEPAITEEDLRFYFKIPELSDELFNKYAAFSQAGKFVLIEFDKVDKFKTQAGKPVLRDVNIVDKYKFKSNQVTSNLLSSADAIDTKSIYFFINNKTISDDLLSIVSETIEIKLLQTEEFKVESTISFQTSLSSVVLNRNLFMACDTSFIHYVAKNKIIVSKTRDVNINFSKLGKSSVKTFAYNLDQQDERLIPFQELNADYINHSYGFDIPGADTENFEVKDNPVLIPHETEYFHNKDTFDGLYFYQKEMINFLMNNARAVFRYDSLLDYKPQTVFALSLLLRHGKVRHALIVKSTSDLIAKNMKKEEEWVSALNTWAPEIPFDLNPCNAVSSKLKPISITNYADLKKLKIKRFDCIIFDRYYEEQPNVIDVINSSEISRVWVIADKNSDAPLNYSTVSISRSRIDEEIPQRQYEYRWVRLNAKQQLEYKTHLAQGQLKISASIDRGEIYIIKPHLFTLLHQLLQTCNFASDENTSSKSDALVQDIKSCSGKVVVLSQYERYGLERIEKLLRAEGIGSAGYKTGSSENEKSLHDFRTKEHIKVLLADAKAINSHLNTGAVSMIIHFDHWWNPVSQWHIEDKLAGSNPVKVIQYCAEETIEEIIYNKLTTRELDDKLIFESLSPSVYSEILTDEEWLKLYDINTVEEYPKPLLLVDKRNKINSLNMDELIIIVQKFISRIGYVNQKTLQHLSDSEVLFMHSRMHNKKEDNIIIFISRYSSIDQNRVRLFYEEYLKHKNVSKAFFITTGKLDPSCSCLFNYQSHKISFADGDRLGRLLHLFNLI